MRPKEELEITSNRSVYNKLRKVCLEKNGEIRCSWCTYHGGENSTNEWYGWYDGDHEKRPNWKLVSKNPKQWMDKPKTYKLEIEFSRWNKKTYYEVKF